jgi:hypothetical protein
MIPAIITEETIMIMFDLFDVISLYQFRWLLLLTLRACFKL